MPKKISAVQTRGEFAKLPAAYAKVPFKPQQRAGERGNAGNRYSMQELIAQKSPSELAQMLSDLCLAIYMSGGQRLIPMQPFVLVRVLPKDMVSDGGIILPNVQQNKPLHEGVVLEVYRPYTVEETIVDPKDKRKKARILRYVCPVKPGDRVAYPHYEGIQHKYLGDDYVLVRQSADQNKFPYMQIAGIVDYKGDREVSRKIAALAKKYYSVTTSGASISRGAEPADVAK